MPLKYWPRSMLLNLGIHATGSSNELTLWDKDEHHMPPLFAYHSKLSSIYHFIICAILFVYTRSAFLTQSNNDGKKEVSFSRPETHMYRQDTDPASATDGLVEQSRATTPAKSILSCSSAVVRRRRTKKSSEPPRPYTPIRSNISVENDHESKSNR